MNIFTLPISTVSTITPNYIVDSLSPMSPVMYTSPIIYNNQYINTPTYTTPFYTNPLIYNTPYYYDSGIGDNPFIQHEINKDLRYKFLDKYLHEDYPEILRMLKSINGVITVLSKEDSEKNDIGKDTESILEDKIDFIGSKILTYEKNQKILYSIVHKNAGVKYYDLPHNTYYVKKEQAKYVKNKLKEMLK